VTPDTHARFTAKRSLSAPALRAFFRICSKWDIESSQARILLGRPARSTFYLWKRNLRGRLSRDTLERISYILGIYKALHIIFSDSEQADGWIKRSNAASLFAGGSAFERMMGGEVADLYIIRRYLDSQSD